MNRLSILTIVLTTALFTIGCTKSTPTSDQEQAPAAIPAAASEAPAVEAAAKPADAPAAAAPVAASKKCTNGEAPKQTKGVCKGVWKFRTAAGENFCDFDWGPKVSCPSGTTALGTPNFCYGTTTKPAGSKIKSAADCLAEFTDAPIAPNYTLECCS